MRQPTGIRFSNDEYSAISRYADENHMPFSEVVRRAVRDYLDPDRAKGYLSLAEIAEEGGDITSSFSQFLDDFKHAHNKAALIENEPTWDPTTAGRWYYDFAATAHKLSHDHGIPVPKWCLDSKYFPKEPFWAFDTDDPEFRAYLMESTPQEFRWHNLYLGPNILKRA